MPFPFLLLLFLLLSSSATYGQTTEPTKPQLTVSTIMQDPDQWIGTLPLSASWLPDSHTFFFEWKKDSNDVRQYYMATVEDPEPVLMTKEDKKKIIPLSGYYNHKRDKEFYSKNGDLFLYDLNTRKVKQLTFTTVYERPLIFSDPDTVIYYLSENNVFSLSFHTGKICQLTDFRKGSRPSQKKKYPGKNDKWLHEQQMQLFSVLHEREARAEAKKMNKEEQPAPRKIYTGDETPSNIRINPQGTFITWLIYHRPSRTKQTDIPHFVTETGYTSIQHARTKAGIPWVTSVDLYLYNRKKDTVLKVDPLQIPGIHDIPSFWKDYPGRDTAGYVRKVIFTAPVWSKDGKHVFIDIYAVDHKDRWLMLRDPATGKLTLLDRQHDDAWIGGPGIGVWMARKGWMPDNRSIWFQSEVTGYSHLYTVDINTGKKKS